MASQERLQKIIAASGIASRRKAEVLIMEGRVSVNGQVITRLGTQADAFNDHIKVDGKLIHPPARKHYILLNKPKGVISTAADPFGRAKVTDYVKAKERLFPVGRLDFNTEGIILLTNDGEFSKIIADAGDAFPKVYQVKSGESLRSLHCFAFVLGFGCPTVRNWLPAKSVCCAKASMHGSR